MSHIIHNTDFESDIYDSDFADEENEENEENEIMDFLGIDGNFVEFESDEETQLFIKNLLRQIPLTTEIVYSLSMNQVLEILLAYME